VSLAKVGIGEWSNGVMQIVRMFVLISVSDALLYCILFASEFCTMFLEVKKLG
jgi:hypothetical protein